MEPKPPGLITVKEARKLLGKQSEALTDDQVEKQIFTLTRLGALHLQSIKVPKK